MSRKKHNPRASRAPACRDTSSRPNYLDTPVWLVCYWLDLAIVDSSFLERRRLLRLRNNLLDFLRVPSGDAWEVHTNTKNQKLR